MAYDDPVVLPIHRSAVWAPDHSMIMRLRKDKRHWWAPAKARSCPRQGRIEPLHTLTSPGLKSSPSLSWNDRWPVAGEGVLANMRRCTSDLRTAQRKFLPQRSRIPRQVASFKGLAAQSACPGPWPLSSGMGCVIEARKGGSQKFLPRRSRIQRQMASFKGLGAQRTCPGLCPVAWGAL